MKKTKHDTNTHKTNKYKTMNNAGEFFKCLPQHLFWKKTSILSQKQLKFSHLNHMYSYWLLKDEINGLRGGQPRPLVLKIISRTIPIQITTALPYDSSCKYQSTETMWDRGEKQSLLLKPCKHYKCTLKVKYRFEFWI